MHHENKNNPRSFVALLLALVFASLASVALFSLIIDPAGVYGLVEAEGFNAEKTAIMDGGGRRDKAEMLGKGGFDAIILGTSRSEIGINPKSPAFKGSNAYNASLAGAYVFEIERAFAFANEHNKLKRVVLSLDFFTFYEHQGGIGDFDESGFATGKTSGIKGLLKLITLDEFLRSFDTLKDNLRGKKSAYTRLGQRRELEGPAKRTTVHDLMRKTFVKSALYIRGSYDPKGLKLIADTIKACRASNVELTLFISPVHALQLENIRLAGAYPVFEDWKRGLAGLINEDAAKNPGLKPIELWDFSGYNAVTTDDFPEPDYAAKEVRWYWEPAHYKENVGDMVLQRIFEDGTDAPPDFGRLVNGKNIEEHLSTIRAERELYHSKKRELITSLERLWQETEEERKASLARGEEPDLP